MNFVHKGVRIRKCICHLTVTKCTLVELKYMLQWNNVKLCLCTRVSSRWHQSLHILPFVSVEAHCSQHWFIMTPVQISGFRATCMMLVFVPGWNAECITLLPHVLHSINCCAARAFNDMEDGRRRFLYRLSRFSRGDACCSSPQRTTYCPWLVSRMSNLLVMTYSQIHPLSNSAVPHYRHFQHPAVPSSATTERQLERLKYPRSLPGNVHQHSVPRSEPGSGQS